MISVFDLDNIDLGELIEDKKVFSEFVYTPLSEALRESQKRWRDKQLAKKMDGYFGGNIPQPLIDGFKAVLFRQLFTPNYELRRFMKTIHDANITPLLLEYHDDKFASNNPLKHALGKMKFQHNLDNDSKGKIETRNIINFNESGGKKIKAVQTTWNQSLINFHHELLFSAFPNSSKYLFDASSWFHSIGGKAKDYYSRYTALFVRNGILFENFVLEGNELRFIKEIFLPSFIEVWKETGKKPMIVSLLPIDTQNALFWMSHPAETLKVMKGKNSV